MSFFAKCLILLITTIFTVCQLEAKDFEKLNVAPKLPDTLGDGGLKRLENELGYVAPRRIKSGLLRYPDRQARRGQEGVVDILFMVGVDGSVFEAIVTDSTHPDFENPAVDAVKNYLYEPATVDGKPTVSSARIRIQFVMKTEEDAAGARFYDLYKRVERKLKEKKPNEKKIRRSLDMMADSDNLSSYALAYLYLLEYRFAATFLTENEQLYALRKVLLFDDNLSNKSRILDEETTKFIRMNILQLLIQLGYYGEARSNYYWLNKEIPEAAEPFNRVMSKVYETLKSGNIISRNIAIPERGYEHIDLTKRRFGVELATGSIEKFNFFCTRKFSTLAFEVDRIYEVPRSWGSCQIQVVGEPLSTAILHQL